MTTEILPDLIEPRCSTLHKWLQIPEERLRRYNAIDTYVTARVWRALRNELQRVGQLDFYHEWFKIVPVAIRMQQRGFGICDWGALDAAQTQIETEAAEIESAILSRVEAFDRAIVEAHAWAVADEASDRAAALEKNAKRKKPLPESEVKLTRETSRRKRLESKLAAVEARRASFFNKSRDSREFLFGQLGLNPMPPSKRDNRPKLSLRAEALRYILDHLRKKDEPHRELLHDFSHTYRLRKILQGYIKPIRKRPTWLRGDRFYPTIKLYGTECISGDSLVWTASGLRTIQTIYEHGRKFKVWNGTEFHTPVAKVRHLNQPGKHLRLAHGLELRGTNHHPVLTPNGWRHLEDLTLDDRVAIYLHTGKPFQGQVALCKDLQVPLQGGNRLKAVQMPHRWSPELCEWIGMWLADGSLAESDNSWHVSLCNSRPDILQHWLQLTKELFGLEGAVRQYGDATPQACVSGKALVDWCKRAGLRNGGTVKEIPAALLAAGEAAWRSVLRGLTLDAHVTAERVCYGTQSPTMQRQIQILLTGMGILSDAGSSLEIVDRHLGLFLQYIGMLPQDRLATAHSLLDRKKTLRDPLGQGVQFVAVRSIQEWRGDVYDLTMPEGTPPQYVANGIVVHNTLRWSYANPSMQNWPPSMLKIVRARPGHVFIAVDKKQIEAGVKALLAGDTAEVQEWLDPQGDLHRLMACDAMRLTREQWDAMDPKQRKGIRERFKRVRYKRNYGGKAVNEKDDDKSCGCWRCRKEATGGAEEYHLPKAQLEAALAQWSRAHPRMEAWEHEHLQSIRDNGNTWMSPFGYRMTSCKPLDLAVREWLNRPMQHSVAVMINRDAIELDRLGAPLVFQHHDALFCEAPIAEADYWRAVMEDVMTRPVPEMQNVRFPIDVKVGEVWSELK